MQVRPAGESDVRAIRRIARVTWHAAYDDVIGPGAVDRQVDEWYDRESVASSVAGDWGHYLVAEADEEVRGYATGGPSEDGPADAVLAAIYVRPERWGEGVGGDLLAAFLERLAGDGHGDVWLAVLEDNERAIGFYERHGFEVDQRRTTTVGGVETTELVMVRPLG